MTPTQSSNAASIIRIVLGGLFVIGVGLLAVALTTQHQNRTGNGGSSLMTVADSSLVDSALRRVQDTTTRSDERLRAIRWLGSTSVEVNQDMLNSFGKGLGDSDPTVRAAIANTIGELGRRANAPQSTDTGINRKNLQEAQLVALLKTAYAKEEVSSVRRAMIEAAANLNNTAVSDLIATALEDKDPSVRETAINAKLSREKRLKLGQMG